MSNKKRVVVTGFGAISPLGNDWETVSAKLKSCTNAVQVMKEWADIKGLHTRLGCPAAPFELDPAKYNRKSTRSMGRVGLLGVRATEVALADAGLLDNQAFLSSGDLGIAYGSSAGTPSAVAAANAADGEIPVVYCAVTDSTTMDNYENITGSSDIPNFEKQLEVVTAFMGKTDLTIGVLYSTEESSSPFQVEQLKKAAEAYDGMQILDSAVSDITTIDTRTNELIDRGVDCFVNLLDNTIVGKLETNILPITNEYNIPVFGSEIEQVKLGCVAAMGLDYTELGKQTGAMAAKVLKGEAKASEMNYETCSGASLYVNTAAAENIGFTLDEEYIADAAETFDEIEG